EPGGPDNSYFQPFDLNLWREIGKETALSWKSGDADEGTKLKLKRDFTPLPFSFTEKFSGPVVFTGYGIVDSDGGYDDYDGAEVKGKIALMLRYEPKFMLEDKDKPSNHTRFAQFQYKVDKANEAGAKAIIIVNPAGPDEADELYDYGNGTGG